VRSNIKTLTREKLVVFTLISAFFLPSIDIGSLNIRVDDVLCLFVFPILIVYKHKIKKSGYLVLAVVPLISILISIFYGYLFLNVPQNYRDYFELIRLSKPFWLIIFLLHCRESIFRTKLVSFFKRGSWFVVFLSFAEFFFKNTAGVFLSMIYAEGQLRGLLTSGSRIFVSGSDPNIGSMIILFFLFFNYFKFLENKKTKRYLILWAILSICLLMTSSRTGFVAYSLTFAFNVIFIRKSSILTKIIFIGTAVVIINFVFQFLPYLTIGFQQFFAGKSKSMIVRYEVWQMGWLLFLDSVYFGWGPAKSLHQTIGDGEHFFLLRRYGIVGYFSILIFLFGPVVFWLIKRKKYFKFFHSDAKILVLVYINMSFCGMIFMITNNVYSGYQLLIPYIILTGYFFVAFKQAHNQKMGYKS
jgi:hypothetical protein